jgi:hypothetical protein
MVQLTECELWLIDRIYDPQLTSVLKDVKDCNYAHLRTQFTKQHARTMECFMGLPLPPPMQPWGQRQKNHYTVDEVWNEMCRKMEAMPALRSTVLERVMKKIQIASQVPIPNEADYQGAQMG